MAVINDPGSEFIMGLQKRQANFYSTAIYLINRKYAKKILDIYNQDGKFDLNRKFYNQTKVCTAENAIFSDGNIYSLPIFLYKTHFESNIHYDHVNDVHKPSSNSQLLWWHSSDSVSRSLTGFFNPTPNNLIRVYDRPVVYKLKLEELNSHYTCQERHAKKIARVLELKIEKILIGLFSIAPNLYSFLYKIYKYLVRFKNDVNRPV